MTLSNNHPFKTPKTCPDAPHALYRPGVLGPVKRALALLAATRP
jgi:hypothetical protein